MRTIQATSAGILLSVAIACTPSPQLARLADPVEATLFRDVAVIDVADGRLEPARDVLVRGTRIAAIADAHTIAPEGATIVEGHGRTLTPGLVDLHVHAGAGPAPAWHGAQPHPERNLEAMLHCGVTTALDLGNLASAAIELREASASGRIAGPHLEVAGPVLTAPGGHPIPVLTLRIPIWLRWYVLPRLAVEVATAADAEEAIASLGEAGVDFVKVAVDRIPPESPRLPTETIRAIVDAAQRHHLRVIAHVGSVDDAVEAARAGVAAWAHVIYRERVPEDRIAEMAEFGIPMISTLVVFESMASLDETPRRATPLERAIAAPDVLAAFDAPPDAGAGIAFQRSSARALRARRAFWGDNILRLARAGVVILAGSDSQTGVFPGAGLHRELALLAGSGLSNGEVLRAATLAPARFLEERPDPSFGTIEVGKRADLLLVDGNPLTDLEALARIAGVWKSGREVVRPAEAPSWPRPQASPRPRS